MNTRNLGIVFLILSSLVLAVVLNLTGGLRQEAEALGCYENAACQKIESSLGVTHLAFGVVGFIFALGFYLVFFSKTEAAILARIETSEKKLSDSERFTLLLRGLDISEQEVLKTVRQQEGITQNTIRYKLNFSKAKLSNVLKQLELRGLISRTSKGKTQALFLGQNV